MVAIKAGQAAQFLKSPPATVNAVLFFGTDPGMINERARTLALLLAAREKPPGEVLRIDDADLDDDAGKLAVELETRPMFSGRRIVRATAGRRISAAMLKPLFASGQPLEGLLIVEAGNLKPDDALRALFEQNPLCAAVACYPDDDAALETLVSDVLGQFKTRIAPDARELLVSRLGADRALSRAEIEKLALYALGRDIITVADVEAVVGDAAALALERIAEQAALGNAEQAIADYGRAIASGESAQAVILIAQRYFLKLHRVRGDMDGGRSLDDALRALRPPLHFKQRDSFASQCRRWTRPRLDLALHRISETARSARLSSALEDTLGERLLLALAALAGSPQSAARRR
ncbi:MAG: DNA polymerase III subunit delta [Hyphomicrobium sp.]